MSKIFRDGLGGPFCSLMAVPSSLLGRWAALVKLYLSAAPGTGSWLIEVSKEKRIIRNIRPRAGSKTNEGMSSAFTGNYSHSAAIKSSRFDPSSLPTSFSANLQIEATGTRGQTEAMKDRLLFMKTITRNHQSQPEALRTVKLTKVLDWTVWSAAIQIYS